MLEIDGAAGEGGGQLLRTALSLSLCLQTPFQMVNIRARRRRPGLQPQHLAAVRAAAALGRAEVTGAQQHSQTLTFTPCGVHPGHYEFDIGTAGSTTLVLQTLLPPLLLAPGPADITLIGGTHNPLAPPFEFLQRAFLPLVNRMGPHVTAELLRPGFYPVGGGEVRLQVSPVSSLQPLWLLQRGALRSMRASALVAHLPRHIGQRELGVLAEAFALRRDQLTLTEAGSARGQGNALVLEMVHEHVTEVFAGIGQRGVRAEEVAWAVVQQARRYLASRVPVGEHLADQLLMPMALAGGGAMRTVMPSLHTLSNIEVIRRFMPLSMVCNEEGEDAWRVVVGEDRNGGG